MRRCSCCQVWQAAVRAPCSSTSRIHAARERQIIRNATREICKQRQYESTHRCRQAFGQSRGYGSTGDRSRKWPELQPSTGNAGRIASSDASPSLCRIFNFHERSPDYPCATSSHDQNGFWRSQDCCAGIEVWLHSCSEGRCCEATGSAICFRCNGKRFEY